MKTVKLGVFGLGRGSHFYNNIIQNGGEVVAVCDRNPDRLEEAKKILGDDLATYTDFDSFLNHEGLEAVFLCNFFHEHAPFAIKALERNIHVLSECTSNGTMAEGVELVRAAEKSKAFYMLSENYPFMKFNREMRRVFQGGTLGKLLFAEGEYNHPGDPDDHQTIRELRPYPNHWRNHLPGTYYVTHSLAPLMYITGATPVRVSAMAMHVPPATAIARKDGDRSAIIMCLNDDNSVFRVTGCAAFGGHENSYRICGQKGQIENIRGGNEMVMLRYNEWEKPEGMASETCYMPEWNDPEARKIRKSGHGGGDYLVIREFFNCIRENKKPMFDEYFATTMASVAILGHRSALEKGVPYDIPDFRKEEDRKKYENDRITPFYGSDGSEPTIDCCSNPDYQLTEAQIKRYEDILAGK